MPYGWFFQPKIGYLNVTTPAHGSCQHECTNQTRFSLFFTKTNERALYFRVPRALLSVSHAQKRSALGSRLEVTKSLQAVTSKMYSTLLIFALYLSKPM